MLGVLRALTSSIDAKDPYTCGHSERVAVISRWLAGEMSFNADQVNNIYLGGLLHDVGKIGVSESVLCKPGVLVKEEFEQICRHPQIGANILGGIKQMFEVTPAVLTHHEQFDGSGYPQGLKGKKIPLAGRIVMLADSFDAMTSDRTYRRALPLATALAEIRRFSGTQFDPVLAEIFLESDLGGLIDQLEEIKAKQQISVSHCNHYMN
jgi:HD-GYP domain-containing protein (c-di-GMP phosphodiesterase class II)